MSVARLQPSATYVQDELRRIQDNLANVVDQASNGVYIPLGHYWAPSYTSGAQPLVFPIAAGSSVGTTAAVITFPYSGNITAVQTYYSGTTSLKQTIVLWKKSVSDTQPSQVASVEIANGGAGTPGQQVLSQPVKVAVGDIVYGMVSFSTAGDVCITAGMFITLGS